MPQIPSVGEREGISGLNMTRDLAGRLSEELNQVSEGQAQLAVFA